MIAARPFQDLARGLGRNAFDLPVAGLAGLAAAFLAFAMPAELLARLVIATGLPHLLAAAEPPLGFKARALLGVAGAGAAFGLAYVLLRLLDRSGPTKAAPANVEAFGEGGPRLRRRDTHPDAPVCRPISAARDFGEPAPPPLAPDAPPSPISVARELDEPVPPPDEFGEPDFPPVSVAPDMDEPAPLPHAFDEPVATPVAIDADFDEPALPQPAPAAPWLDADVESGENAASEQSPWGRRRDLYSGTPGRQSISSVQAFADTAPPEATKPVAAPAPAKAAAPAWLPELAGHKAAEPAPAPVAAPLPAPTVAPAPPPVVAPAPIHAAEPAFEPVPEPVPERAQMRPAEPALGPATEASLAELMRRLEQGLAHRRTGHSFTAVPQPDAPAPQVFPEANDDRLQSAIESLQRLAARGD